MIYLLLAVLVLSVIMILLLLWKMQGISKSNTQLRAVVNNQNNYAFLVDRSFEVKTSNMESVTLVSEDEPNVLGNVLHCKNAHKVGRCGESEACRSCPLRFVITKSFERGCDFSGVDACMEVYDKNEKLVDMDVEVEGRFVNLNAEDHMVINVKNTTIREDSLPKVLLISDNMALYDKVRVDLANEYRVLGADNDRQAFHRLQLVKEYQFHAVLTDMKFFSANKDVIKLMAKNDSLPLFVFTTGDVPAEGEGVHFISETISGQELSKLVLAQ